MNPKNEEAQEKLKKIFLSVRVINEKIFCATKYTDPRVSNLVVIVSDENNLPIQGCEVEFTCGKGIVDRLSYTDKNGLALSHYYSFKLGRDIIKVKARKEGYEPAEAEAQVEVIENATPLKVVNTINSGYIFLNGEKIGEGKASVLILNPGIYTISWGDVDGYRTPNPIRIYINPNFSVEPVIIEGHYVQLNEKREYINLTVFVCITLDDTSGVPNPVSDAQVMLSDGQVGVTDRGGFARFKVKSGLGPLKIKAKHPNLYECYQEAEVNVEDKDLHVNLDFGMFFGGEAVVGLEI